MKYNLFRFQPCVWPVLICLMFLSTACISRIKGWSQESYRIAGFSSNILNHEGLAILPVIMLKQSLEKTTEADGKTPSAPYAPVNTADRTGEKKPLINQDIYRSILSEILLSKIQLRHPSLRVVSPGNALKQLNDNGLTGAYVKFNRDFPKLGFDSTLLKQFGKTLNCRYLFISQAIVSESKSEASLTFIWTFGRKSTHRSVKMAGQIWDTDNGRQIWEGLGVGYNDLFSYEKSPLIEEIASQAIDSLLKNIMP
jgi:hypothetical protein